ncbi:unnamed protein product [Rotaria sp. Silwood1]|nr:unnamed protein product [Rotaria sp. Silwood1]CAF3488269.1 unnamed protein product [Rotaria sp. Silwood1]
MRITNDNTLYIADLSNSRIVVIEPNSTTAIAIIQNGSDSNPLFVTPNDVFVTQKYIYVLDITNSHVIRFFKNRTNPVTIAGITGQYGGPDNTSTIGTCYSIFVDNNENLYVSDFSNNRVVRYSSNSSSGMPGVVIAGRAIGGSNASQFNGPWGIFVNEVGTLYVADLLNHRIQRWDKGASSGVTVAGTGLGGNNLSQLYYPMAIVVDSNEYMYILDSGNNRILRWAPNSDTGECIAACTGNTETGVETLNWPYTLAFDSYGSLFISDSYNNRVQKFQILSSFGE